MGILPGCHSLCVIMMCFIIRVYLRLINLKCRVFDLAGLRNGRKVLARSRCSPTNTIVKKRFLCYVSSSFPTQNKMSN